MASEHCQRILDNATICSHLAVQSTFLYSIHPARTQQQTSAGIPLLGRFTSSVIFFSFVLVLECLVGELFCFCSNRLDTPDWQVSDQVKRPCHADLYQPKSVVMYLMVQPFALNHARLRGLQDLQTCSCS